MSDARSAAATTVPALEAKDLHKAYRLRQETIEILSGLDLVVARGESVAVVGASGSGKTTMINMLGLLDRPDTGSVRIAGEDALAASGSRRAQMRNQRLGFVFQFYHLVNELSALDNVLLPARIGAPWFGWSARKAEMTARARALLARVGLAGRESHRPQQLSGGERQRVAIARALVLEPDVVFCDEPTGNLDPRTARGVQDLLLEVAPAGRAMLLVTHDEAFARRCDRVLRLADGRLRPSAADAASSAGTFASGGAA
ncbi:MAG: ABC transporter ATP-binding protein [Planctomycetes bacterium]|nr:ABC transporter ATP-binding protein [Planctomycetota bacterium]